jgi:hypothetical protein
MTIYVEHPAGTPLKEIERREKEAIKEYWKKRIKFRESLTDEDIQKIIDKQSKK